MIVVVDTNILLASLIRDSTIRKIIVESDWKFFYPEVSFHEVRKYKYVIGYNIGPRYIPRREFGLAND